MKTLSIRQPWAELILQGRKTLELRSWTVKYRGPLAIHASQTVEREACRAHGLDPDRVTAGAVIGVVDLVEIIELDAAAFAARRRQHLAGGGWAGAPLYGWRLAHPRRLPAPQPLRGRMGLFETPVGEGAAAGEPGGGQEQGAGHADAAPPARAPGPTPRAGASFAAQQRPFEMRVLPAAAADPGGAPYRLALFQRLLEPAGPKESYDPPPPPTQRVAELGGLNLRVVADHVIESLRANGYKATDLAASRREPFALAEESGVRLGLLFLAVRPVVKVERIEVIAQGIGAMTSEEVYYWYSKCTGGTAAERSQKALRVLLAEE